MKKTDARIKGTSVAALTTGGPWSGVISQVCSYSLLVAIKICQIQSSLDTAVNLPKSSIVEQLVETQSNNAAERVLLSQKHVVFVLSPQLGNNFWSHLF